jgi:predicted enzyme related to lactoylglutathione lyase
MTVRETPWPQGTPSWADCQVDDPAVARAFYSGVFGWDVQDPTPEAGGYLMAHLDGHVVAGIGGKPDPSLPSTWTTYLAVDDADAVATGISEAGGSLMMAPFDVMDAGRMAVAIDSTGAAFGIWQATTHAGADLVDEPGAMTWNECHTRDLAASRAFYAQVFGWTYAEIGDESFAYSVAKSAGDGSDVAGIYLLGPQVPAEVPAYWLVWFAVSDTDATVARARELGGGVALPAMDSAFGRMACLTGPSGERFGIVDRVRHTSAG